MNKSMEDEQENKETLKIKEAHFMWLSLSVNENQTKNFCSWKDILYKKYEIVVFGEAEVYKKRGADSNNNEESELTIYWR